MNIRNFLFKLRLCHGIGINGEHNVYLKIKSLIKNKQLIDLSVKDIIKIAKISTRFKTMFKQDYASQGLKDRIKQNQQEKWLCILDDKYP